MIIYFCLIFALFLSMLFSLFTQIMFYCVVTNKTRKKEKKYWELKDTHKKENLHDYTIEWN